MPTTNPLSYQAPTRYSSAYGGIPTIPNPEDTLEAALAGTNANWKDIKNLGAKANTYMVNQYTGRVPGYKDMSAQSSENIAAALRGEVPQDVVNQLAQSAAERGIMRGIPGSQASSADYLRGLGLTSLGQQKYGEEALTGATHRLDQVAQFNPMSYAISPEMQFNAQREQNVLNAAPTPGVAEEQAKRDIDRLSTVTPGRTTVTTPGGGGATVPSPVASNPYANPNIVGRGTYNVPDVTGGGGGSLWNQNAAGNFVWGAGTQSANTPIPMGAMGLNTYSGNPLEGYNPNLTYTQPDIVGPTQPWYMQNAWGSQGATPDFADEFYFDATNPAADTGGDWYYGGDWYTD